MEDLIFQVLGAIVTAAISFGSMKFAKLSGIQIDEKHQRQLHEALMSGAMAFVEGNGTPSIRAVVGAAIAHARGSVPDALNHLNPSQDVLQAIARRKAAEALGKFNA